MIDLDDHLKSRGVDLSLYNSFVFDYVELIVTVLCYNLSGQITGYQRYNPLSDNKGSGLNNEEFRYFTYGSKNHLMPVFGLDVLDYDKPDLYVVEGLFKATKLHSLGLNAIAVFTSTPKPLKGWFSLLKKRFNLVAVGDNDQAGQKLVNAVGTGFLSPIDLDEMTNEEVLELLDVAQRQSPRLGSETSGFRNSPSRPN